MRLDYILAFLLLLFVMPFVSAQYYGGGYWGGTEQMIDSVVQNLEPLFRVLLGGYDWGGYLLFEKILLFILISIIVGVILGNLPFFTDYKHKGILRFVAVIIGLLGVRNLNYVWVGTILVQYQILFIAVAGVLPFIIYWYFVKGFDSPLRKMSWVFYSVIYFGLWLTTELEAYSAVYLWGALVGLVYAFFVDEWFTRWLQMREVRLGDINTKWENINQYNKRIADIHASTMPPKAKNDAVKALEKARRDIMRSMRYNASV